VILWGRELQVKEKKIKQLAIKYVEDAVGTVIIGKKGSAHFVVSVEPQS
jgi:hypothetical protein